MKCLLREDTDYPRHLLANCQASMVANIRWTMTQSINALIPGHTAEFAGDACYNDAMVDVEGL